ncbi:hypothetical protein GCM10011331_06300 [Flavimobilis marinus]|nr:hypothetical protein GCM10011331_06300 [Flavimobilis marinus]
MGALFGEGRSHTTVEYSDLVVETPVVTATDDGRARVTNTGERPALETI